MSTNRTKIDWAYRAAKKFLIGFGPTPHDICELAKLLRTHYRRGLRMRTGTRDGETGGA